MKFAWKNCAIVISFMIVWSVLNIFQRFNRPIEPELTSSTAIYFNVYESVTSKNTTIALTWNKLETKIFKRQNWFEDQQVILRTSNCDGYFEHIFPVPGADEGFLKHENDSNPPLAFSHLVHTQSCVLEVFLSVYFRPNNFYCIHVDRKANQDFQTAINNLVKCYSKKMKNGAIFTLPKSDSFSVDWGGNTMLKADLKCLAELLEQNHLNWIRGIENIQKWSHSASIAGTELPLVTYSSFRNTITRKLGKDLSSVESFLLPQENLFRISDSQNKRLKILTNGIQDQNTFEMTNPLTKITNSTTSSNDTSNNQMIEFKIFKGIRNVILSSKDVDLLTNHEVAKEMLNWFSLGQFSEEHFYSTVIRFRLDDKNITNSVIQDISADEIRRNRGGITFTSGNTLHGICPRYTDWGCTNCFGQCINSICNFHLQDLERIAKDSNEECLIANKFNLDVDPNAVLQQWINILRKMFVEQMNDDGRENHSLYWTNVMQKISFLVEN